MMVARAPRVLVLHLNRSAVVGYRVIKNPVRVQLVKVLDIEITWTAGDLDTHLLRPLSAVLKASAGSAAGESPSPVPAPTVPAPRRAAAPPQVRYFLQAMVVHYARHDSGH
ncbi:hypothetical protein GGF31_009013 [Allomyces arbusculus]|nr:hypothetical protein GGF31_009013 [Allomyces arbusculus]